MCHKTRFCLTGMAFLGTACLVTAPSLGVVKYSYNASGQQIWITVDSFSARSQLVPGTYDFIEDAAAEATGPLSGKAFYFPLIAGDPSSSPTVFMDAWVEYQISPDDLPADIIANLSGAGSNWYFWARATTLHDGDSANYNKDSDWLIVNGDPNNLNVDPGPPSDAQWFAADSALNPPTSGVRRGNDRICNDVLQQGGEYVVNTPPNPPTGVWKWIGHSNSNEDATPRLKLLKLINNKVTFRIYEAEASNWNARIDAICWANHPYTGTPTPNYTPADTDYATAITKGECLLQHETTPPVSPASQSNADPSGTTLTVTGANLEAVTSARLVRNGGGAPDIIASAIHVGPGPNETSMTIDFPTTSRMWGVYDVVTEQAPPCFSRTLLSAFELQCPNPTAFTAVEPSTIANPSAGVPVQLRIKGDSVTALTSVSLRFANRHPTLLIAGTALTPDGDDLLATFNLTDCTREGGSPAGPYNLEGTRDAGACPNPDALLNALWITKPPTGAACAWQPWASSWSNVNSGPGMGANSLDPTVQNYNPTNWDYGFTQTTVMNTPKDTPPGGGLKSGHFFWDSQPPDTTSTKAGSGGIYQEVQVTPGVPIEYSFWWKIAATQSNNAWAELILLDGPWNLFYADGFQEAEEGKNNPQMVRKTVLNSTAGITIPWTQVTDADPADSGNYGPRPQTITPTRDIVTVVFKTGRAEQGGLELFLDNVNVHQNGGGNMIVNGEFENTLQVEPCNGEYMFKDKCEQEFWRRSPDTPPPTCAANPFDVDGDSDVDQADFAYFQACYSGSNWPAVAECKCLDFDKDDNIDQTDLLAFENCASGPGVLADPDCAAPPP
jgi:hypothetical protein